MALRKETFTAQLDADLMEKLRQTAEREHTSVEGIVEEALLRLIEARNALDSRVRELHEDSVREYDEVYRHLAQ